MAKNATTQRRHLVGIAQASEYADVNPRTIRRWIAAGHLRGYRVGPRLLKVDLNDVDAMLQPIPTSGGAA